MKTKAIILALALTVGMATAECPNACSGHGTCNSYDNCECFTDWIGGDCSQRVCPFGLAFVTTPLGDLNHNGDVSVSDNVPVQWGNWKNEVKTNERWNNAMNGEGHAYTECSGKGLCDRATGLCECFDGYTGASCQRTSCPNECSAHGMCHTLREIASGVPTRYYEPVVRGRNFRISKFEYGTDVTAGVNEAFSYNIWDADKNQACVCDSGYFGVDCSLRDCPRGADPLQLYQEQQCDAELIKKQLIVFKITDDVNATEIVVRVGSLESSPQTPDSLEDDDLSAAVVAGFNDLGISAGAYALTAEACYDHNDTGTIVPDCNRELSTGDIQIFSLAFQNPEYAASPVVIIVSESPAYTVESFYYLGGDCVNGAAFRSDGSTPTLDPNVLSAQCSSDICSCKDEGGFIDATTDVTTAPICAASERQTLYFERSGDGSGDTYLILEWLDNISTFNSYTGSRLRSDTVKIPGTGTVADIKSALRSALDSFPNGILKEVSLTCYKYSASGSPSLDTCPSSASLENLSHKIAIQLDFTPHSRNGSPNPVVVYTVDHNDIPANPANSLTVESFYIRDSECKNTANLRTYTDGAVAVENVNLWEFSNACIQLGVVEGYDDNLPCSNRGLCEYASGECKCFAGYTREDCSVQSALAM